MNKLVATVELIENLSDNEVVVFLESISQEIAKGIEVDVEPLVQELHRDSPELGDFVAWSMSRSELALSSSASVAISRDILNCLVMHSDIGPYIEKRAEVFVNPKMCADIVLSLGIASSMIFLATSTKLSVSYDKESGLRIILAKEIVPHDTIKAIIDPLTDVAKNIRMSVDKAASTIDEI